MSEILIKANGQIKQDTRKVNKAINDATSIVNYNVDNTLGTIDALVHSPETEAYSIRNTAQSLANYQVNNYFNLIEDKISEVVEKTGVQNPVVQSLIQIANNAKGQLSSTVSQINEVMKTFIGYGGYVLGTTVVDLSTPQQIWRNAIAKWEDIQTKAVVFYEDIKSQTQYLYENALEILAESAAQIGDEQIRQLTGLTRLQIMMIAIKTWKKYKKFKLAKKKKDNEKEESEENKKTPEQKKLERQQKKEQLKQQKQQEKSEKKKSKEQKKKEIKSIQTSEINVDVNVDILKAEFINELMKLSDPIYNAVITYICIDEMKECVNQFKNVSFNTDLRSLIQSIKTLADIITLFQQLGVSSNYPTDFYKSININTFFNVFNNMTSVSNLNRVISLSSTTTFALDTSDFNSGNLTLTLYTDPNTNSQKLKKILNNIELWSDTEINNIMNNAKNLYSQWIIDKNSQKSLILQTKSKTNNITINVNIMCDEPIKETFSGTNVVSKLSSESTSALSNVESEITENVNGVISNKQVKKLTNRYLDEEISQVNSVANTQISSLTNSLNSSVENTQSELSSFSEQFESSKVNTSKDYVLANIENLKSDTVEESYVNPNNKTKIQAPFLTTVFRLLENLEPLLNTFSVLLSNFKNNKEKALNAASVNIDAIRKQFIDDLEKNNHNISKIDTSNYNVYFIRTEKAKELLDATLAEKFTTTDKTRYNEILNQNSSLYTNQEIKLLNLDETSYFKLLLDEENIDSTDIEEGYYTLIIINIDENYEDGSSDNIPNIIWINSENTYYVDTTTSDHKYPSQVLENYYNNEKPFVEKEESTPINDFSDLYVYTDEMEGDQVISLNNINLCDTTEIESNGLTPEDVVSNISNIVNGNGSKYKAIVEIGQPTIEKPQFGKTYSFNQNLNGINNNTTLGQYVDSNGTTKTIKSIFSSGNVLTNDNQYQHLFPNAPHDRHIIIENCELGNDIEFDTNKIDEIITKLGAIGILESFITDNLNYSILPNILLRRKELKDGYVDDTGNFIYYAMEGFTGTEIYAKWKTHIDNTIDNYYEIKGISKKERKKLCDKQTQQIKNTKGNSTKLQNLAQSKIDKRNEFIYGHHLISQEKNGIIDLYESYRDNPSALIKQGILSPDMEACRYTQDILNENQELGLADCYGLGVDYYLTLLENIDTLSGNQYVLEYYNILSNIIQKHNAFKNIDADVVKTFIIDECKNLNFTNISYKEIVNKLDNEFSIKPSINEVYQWLKKNVFIDEDELVFLQRIANIYVYYRSINKDYVIEKTITNADGTTRDLSILDLIEEDKNLLEAFWSKIISEFKTTYNLSKIIDELKTINDVNENKAQWPEPIELTFNDEVYNLYTFVDTTNDIEDDAEEKDEDVSNIVTNLPKDITEFKPDISHDINDLSRTEPSNTNSIYTLKYWKKYFSLATLISLPYTATGLVIKHHPILLPAIFIPFTVVYQKQINILLVVGISIRGVYIDPIILYLNTSSDFSSTLTPLISIMNNVYKLTTTKINLVELNIVELAKTYKNQLIQENNNLKKEIKKLEELKKGLQKVKAPTFKDIDETFKGFFSPITQYIRRTTDLVNKTKMEFNQMILNASTAVNNLKDSIADKEAKEKQKTLQTTITQIEDEISNSVSNAATLDELSKIEKEEETTTQNESNNNG